MATEVLSSIRTVFAFGGEFKEEMRLFDILCIHRVTQPEHAIGHSFLHRYEKHAKEAEVEAIKGGFFYSVFQGTAIFFTLAAFGIAFW